MSISRAGVLAVLVIACSSDPTNRELGDGGPTGAGGTSGDSTAVHPGAGASGSVDRHDGSTAAADGPPARRDAGTSDSSRGPTDASAIASGGSGAAIDSAVGCQFTAREARRRTGGEADVIWALDGSLSMIDEALAIQSNLVDFDQRLTSAGIDVRVVFIGACETNRPQPVEQDPGFLINAVGISVDAPLGSGQACPDDSSPPPDGRFLHVLRAIDSHNALERLQNTYSIWQSVVRTDSAKTIVVVTDDAANPAPTVDEVTAFWDQQWSGTVWRFSGVFCVPGQSNTTGCASQGDAYAELVTRTGGTQAHLPTADWNGVFQRLGDAVIADTAPVDCQYLIPDPPTGTLDADLVNVRLAPQSGNAQLLVSVSSASLCSDQFLGWYYDDPVTPGAIVLCPETCSALEAEPDGPVEVLFGCATRRGP